MPVSGSGRALYQPIWAEDVADCVVAALRGDDATTATDGVGSNGHGVVGAGAGGRKHVRHELAGPETLSHTEIVRTVLRSLNRRRPLVHVPTPIVSRTLRLLETIAGPSAFATWEEAELMEVAMTSERGTADAESLGVHPARMAAVLGTG
jgi:NADH dehydrogenase